MADDEQKIEALRPPDLSDEEWSMLLCQLGLMQIFTASNVKREGTTLRYYLDGKLRAVAETDNARPDVPHGPFSVFYKDGQSLWITGEYHNGRPRHDTWVTFLPDGRVAKPSDKGLH
jgi:antitoxin component YwqK of YwqJK toxin-antitoxin module